MEIIDRYIYAVTKRLPLNQREDLEQELRSLIDDMLSEYENKDQKAVEDVLMELGSPTELANKYRENKRYLISPESFDNYLAVLKIVMSAVFFVLTVAFFVGTVFSNDKDIFSTPINYIGSLFDALLQAAAWVTLIFFIIDNKGYRKDNVVAFKLSDLPKRPINNAKISRASCIVGLTFSTIFYMIMLVAPELFSAYLSSSGQEFSLVPIFDLAVVKSYSVIFIALFALTLIKEVLKFIAGNWTISLASVVIIISIGSLILTLSFFNNPEIWNSNFITELAPQWKGDVKVTDTWKHGTTWAIPRIIILGTIIDGISTLVNGIKGSK